MIDFANVNTNQWCSVHPNLILKSVCNIAKNSHPRPKPNSQISWALFQASDKWRICWRNVAANLISCVSELGTTLLHVSELGVSLLACVLDAWANPEFNLLHVQANVHMVQMQCYHTSDPRSTAGWVLFYFHAPLCIFKMLLKNGTSSKWLFVLDQCLSVELNFF